MSRPSAPFCVEHGREMSVVRNGTRVLLSASFGPYELWAGDEYECPSDGKRIVTGWADGPVWRHTDDRPLQERWVDLKEAPR